MTNNRTTTIKQLNIILTFGEGLQFVAVTFEIIDDVNI